MNIRTRTEIELADAIPSTMDVRMGSSGISVTSSLQSAFIERDPIAEGLKQIDALQNLINIAISELHHEIQKLRVNV